MQIDGIQQRMKQSGMRWSINGGQDIAHRLNMKVIDGKVVDVINGIVLL